jgi:anti-sigma28 factor (negative regulator of flagellin synthesis)
MAINNIGNISGANDATRAERADGQRTERTAAQETQAQPQKEVAGRDTFQAQDAVNVKDLAAKAAAVEIEPREDLVEQAKIRVSQGYYDTPKVREGVARQVLGGGLIG